MTPENSPAFFAWKRAECEVRGHHIWKDETPKRTITRHNRTTLDMYADGIASRCTHCQTTDDHPRRALETLSEALEGLKG